MSRFILLIFFLTGIFVCKSQQIRGKILDENGQPLPFSSVYINGTSIGTTTNAEGNYALTLEPGSYQIEYQYVGYQSKSEQIIVQTNQDIIKDIQLFPLEIKTAEVLVRAGEDPAYEIIRQAIKKRKYFLTQLPFYNCESYVKGIQKVEGMPDKIMGRSLGQLRNGLDSNGNGIIYLSESVSKIYYKDDQFKEEMISSKVSGNDNGFSFNSGIALTNFNFYENELELNEARLLSPIADQAMGSYRYKLITTFSQEGKLISKIQVIPKNDSDPLFDGFIYIVNDEWAIHSTELRTTGKKAHISLLDTVVFTQMHIPLNDSIRKIFSQEISFHLNLFQIKIFGRFLGVFRNYDTKTTLNKNIFNADLVKVSSDANQKDSLYWNEVRPIPLTEEERAEYEKKDSLQKIWKTKAYQDSLDKKTNKPNLSILISGYTYRNRHKRWSIELPSPLTTLSFNTVQGYYGNLGIIFNKSFDEERTKVLSLETQYQFGFSDKTSRGVGRIKYKWTETDDNQIEITGGKSAEQFNSAEPINANVNMLYCLFGELNYIKLFDKSFIDIQYSQRAWNLFYLQGNLSYQWRSALQNTTDHTFINQESRSYFSNKPLDYNQPPMVDSLSFQSHKHFQFDFYLRIRPGQKVLNYPKRKFYLDTDYPEIWIHYKKAIPISGFSNTDFDYLSLTIQKTDMDIGTAGSLSYRAKYGLFLRSNAMFFMDFNHFMGNQTVFAKANYQWRSYQMLPYYLHSTNTWYTEAHVEWNMRGLILNKIPLIKKLGFETLIGCHFLYTPEMKDYTEFTFGLSRLGWKLFRFGRLDFVMNYKYNEKPKFGMVFSINFTL